tara:strand:- start:2534 stop:4186 length:1653 start_codon:yes stop_codon:yes gene_type:complete
MKFILMGLVKSFTKEMGRAPNVGELKLLKREAEIIEQQNKIIPFPGGGKDKVSPFTPRPENKKSIDLAKELEELTNKNLEERGLGSIKLGDELPPPKNKKPDVDPTLQAMEDQIEMFKDFSNRIKGMSSTDRVAERLKDLKNVNLSDLSGIEAQKIASEVIGRKGPFKTISSKGAKEVLGELEPIIKRADAEPDLGTKLKNFDGDPDAMAEGGIARIGMRFGGGISLRRLLQYLAGTSGKKGSQNLKDFKIDDQMKFFADKQGVSADQNRIDYLEQVLESLYADKKLIQNLEPSASKMDIENQAAQKFRKDYIDETQGGRYEGLTSDAINESILELETILKNLKTKDRKPNAIGGRIGFDKGSPPSKGRRNFLKLMGGLASIPVFGKLFKAAKPAAKVAKTVEQTTSGVPAYFPKLVEKIKMLGDDITPMAATQERQVVTKYKNYEMTEDLSSGAIEIEKTNTGMAVAGDEVYEGIKSKELIEFKPPETIIGKDGKPVKVPAQYEETTARPTNMEGDFEDFDDGLESIDEVLDEVRMKKSGGGVAYMLGE